ncbi:MAG: 4-hydroxy-3-methylbut-2-enyl diphosphate reductase [Candidatus Aminicenantes bacterium]|nr:4-hydroxy-3-methylbut-2-enyl diphosphate reductase [Candidatus Aminicenantes bacterium]
MIVRIADQAGFCFGVKRALELIHGLRNEGRDIQVLGELIHNQSVLSDLTRKGVACIQDRFEADPKKTLVIRTHGIPADEEEKLRQEGFQLLDVTCPLVKKTHCIIERFEKDGIPVVIVGDRNHPEIIAASSYATDPIIVNSLEEARAVPAMPVMGVVAQTTLDLDFFGEIEAVLAERADHLEVHNTVCEATRERQEAVRRLAPQVDCVVVVGGHNSSNTKKLAHIARRHNPRTIHINGSLDLDKPELQRLIRDCRIVGIAAGASTPPEEIERVRNYLSEYSPKTETRLDIDQRRMQNG